MGPNAELTEIPSSAPAPPNPGNIASVANVKEQGAAGGREPAPENMSTSVPELKMLGNCRHRRSLGMFHAPAGGSRENWPTWAKFGPIHHVSKSARNWAITARSGQLSQTDARNVTLPFVVCKRVASELLRARLITHPAAAALGAKSPEKKNK